MPVVKGDVYSAIKRHLIEILCVVLLLIAAFKVLRAEWPF